MEKRKKLNFLQKPSFLLSYLWNVTLKDDSYSEISKPLTNLSPFFENLKMDRF